MKPSKWILYNKKGDFRELGARLSVDPVLARIMINRDIDEADMESFLHPSLDMLHDPRLLRDSDTASKIIRQAISDKDRIRVIGDYDVDGIFSTFILVSALRRLGAEVSYDIPHRITDGYGMNERLIRSAFDDGISLIVTCDNGIKAMDEAALAASLGMKVIITDHHELGFDLDEEGKRIRKLPGADAVINPHRPDCPYPFKEICGAVVAWKLVTILLEDAGLPGAAMEYLPYAAFATIGDIMPLRDENRAIVHFGLKRMPEVDNPGLLSLMERTGVTGREPGTYDVGFVLGPCFNAGGRLDTALRGVELLLERDPVAASAMAEALRNLNDQRKLMTEEGTALALEQIEDSGHQDDAVLVEYVPGLHESLAGIVAGRIKERYYRPVFILTDARTGLKGSGRSIPGYPMADKLHDVEDLLIRYGGHPMAAGVSLLPENVSEFSRRLNEGADISDEDLIATRYIDIAMPTSYISYELVEQLSMLEPFGEGNERPLFAEKDVVLTGARYMGSQDQFIKFSLPGNGTDKLEAVYFQDASKLVELLTSRFGEEEMKLLFSGRPSSVRLTFSYYPMINTFRGRTSLQVRIEDYK